MSYGNWNARSPWEVQRQNGKALDFDKAKALYESVKPLQGKRKTLDVRPIGERDRAWERVVKVSDTEYYLTCSQYSYYDNQRLGYEPKDEGVVQERRAITLKQEGQVETIILHQPRFGWASPSTFFFYDFNLPQGMGMSKYRGTNYVKVQKPDNPNHYSYYTMDKGDTTFYRPKGGTYWTPLQVHREVVHSLNRKKTKAIREELKDFMEYAKSMIPFVEGKYQWGAIIGNDWRAQLKREGKDTYPEEWLSVLTRFAGKCQRYDWETRTYYATEKSVLNAIQREVYKQEKPFDTKVVELGEMCRDPYKSWL